MGVKSILILKSEARMSVEKFSNLKKRFLQFLPEQRRALTESLHKVNLGVESQNDISVLTKFLGFDAHGLNPTYAEELLAYLLMTGTAAKTPVAPVTLGHDMNDTDNGLPEFTQDDTDTLLEDVKPFK